MVLSAHGLIGDTRTGFLLFITHVLACITVGVLFRFWKYKSNSKESKNKYIYTPKKQLTFSNLGTILSESIINSFNTIIMIGGFIVLFSVILSILEQSKILEMVSNVLSPFFCTFNINHNFLKAAITGVIELTNGLEQVCSIANKSISFNIILCAFLLGFGGISVLLQVYSIVSSSDISIKPYIIGKSLQGIFASIYTYLIINNFNFFNLDLIPTFSGDITKATNYYTSNMLFVFFIILSIIIFYVIFNKFINKKGVDFRG